MTAASSFPLSEVQPGDREQRTSLPLRQKSPAQFGRGLVGILIPSTAERVRDLRRLGIVSALLGLCLLRSTSAAEPSGNAVIRAPFRDSEIVIATTERLAGAIHSLTWNGQEFIDSADHGRQLQSASNFDNGTPFTPETFNPTEAGSRRDGAGFRTTSRLLHLIATENALQTTSQMAFWLLPFEKSGGHPAKNREALSNHLLTKRVVIGERNLGNVIRYDVTFGVPIGETHTYAQFEALTGYQPPEFSRFLTFDPSNGNLSPLSDGPGEQPRPIVFSTESGAHAMGIFSPDQPSPGFEQAGYGRFRFTAERVVKWNCVFRRREPTGIPPGDYSFRMFVIVGDLETVRETMQTLTRSFQ